MNRWGSECVIRCINGIGSREERTASGGWRMRGIAQEKTNFMYRYVWDHDWKRIMIFHGICILRDDIESVY